MGWGRSVMLLRRFLASRHGTRAGPAVPASPVGGFSLYGTTSRPITTGRPARGPRRPLRGCPQRSGRSAPERPAGREDPPLLLSAGRPPPRPWAEGEAAAAARPGATVRGCPRYRWG